MAVAWPSAARPCSRAWRANLHRIQTAIIPQGCNTDQYGAWEGIYVCILMGRGKEKQVFLAEHNFCEPTNQLDHRSQYRFCPQHFLFQLGTATGAAENSPSTLCAQRKWARIPRRGNKLMTWGHGSLPTQGFSAVGHSRSLLGKSPPAPFPRKSPEQAYSLLQHPLKTLFSVKCLICW